MAIATQLENGQSTDASLQLAPTGANGPDHATLAKSFETCMSNLQSFIGQCSVNFDVRYALWSGQSSDGRKHAREGAKIDPTPWDGASDLQVFLTDEAIISMVALLSTVFDGAGISAVPIEGGDIKRAKTVSSFMRWLIKTQIPEVQREIELLANYINEQGIGAMGVFWEDSQEKVLQNVSLAQLQQQFPDLDMQALIFSEDQEDHILAIFTEIYGCTKAKARKMVKELRNDQQTTVPTLGRKKSRPVWRAFNLNQNLFVPSETADPEHASAMFRVEYFSAEQLRAFVHSSGWDEGWVEQAILSCKGTYITNTQNQYNQPYQRSFTYQQTQYENLIGVVFAYQRLSDEDGYTGLYQTIFNPKLAPDGNQPGYAKFGLLGYADGQYPFVFFPRERLSRKLHDTRGIPEPGKPLQQQIKVHQDSLIDAASLSICPPMGYPHGRPPQRWGAGARVPERRPGEYHFLDRPAYDPSTEKSQAQLQADFNRYNGFVSDKTDPQFASLKLKATANRFLGGMSKVLAMTWDRYKQFGNEQVYFRVVGLKQADPVEFKKGDESEEFDFYLKFSIDNLDPENVMAKLEQVAKIVATADRDGSVDYHEMLVAMIEAVDPVLAERLIRPVEEGQQKIVAEIQDTLAKVYAGQDHDLKENTPPEISIPTIQNYIQGDPIVQSKMANPEDPFGKRIEKLLKQANFVQQQRQNSVIGKLGTAPAPSPV